LGSGAGRPGRLTGPAGPVIRSLADDPALELAPDAGEGGVERLAERAAGPLQALVRLGIPQGVPDRGERLVELIDHSADGLVDRFALFFRGGPGCSALLPVLVADLPAHVREVLPHLVPCSPGPLRFAGLILRHLEPPRAQGLRAYPPHHSSSSATSRRGATIR